MTHAMLASGVTLTRPSGGAAEPALLEDVRRIFADVTRYPLEILELQANLEEDLGIDSVKLGEIFAVFREKYNLPPMTELQGRFAPERLRTIAGVTGLVAEFVTASPATAVAESSAAGAPPKVETVLAGVRVGERGEPRARRPFEGKVALVTGSGRGLGKAVARHLADLGATVVVNSFHSRALGESTTAEINAAGGRAVHMWASVASDEQRNALFDEIESQFGALDFFISNASNGILAPLADVTPEHWEKAFRTNVVALQQGAIRAAKLMRRRGGGKIITVSSNAANRYAEYFGCMAPVKAAVESLTKYLAVELAPDNIQVNCVCSGAVYGELIEKWPESAKLVPKWEQEVPVGRLTKPSDVSAMVGALLNDELQHVTGAVIVVDGGRSVG